MTGGLFLLMYVLLVCILGGAFVWADRKDGRAVNRGAALCLGMGMALAFSVLLLPILHKVLSS